MFFAPPTPIPAEKTVVLVVPAAGLDNEALLRATLVAPGKSIRVLLFIPQDADQTLAVSLAKMLTRLGVETQILFHSGMDKPNVGDVELQAPKDMSGDDQVDFALALSDAVLVAGESKLKKTAESLHKQIVRPGEEITPALQPPSITRGLHPDRPWWLSYRQFIFGRFEQAITEILAFAWSGWNPGGRTESAKKLGRCFWKWEIKSYFSPEDTPDQAARSKSSPIVRCFEAMDRSAVHGSYMHRDLTWVIYLSAAAAVFAAVAGALTHAKSWGWLELGILGAVLVLYALARLFKLQERWTACRLGAEQLRIARMTLPLQVLPWELATTDAAPAPKSEILRTKEAIEATALREVKRAVRDHGLPRLAGTLEPSQAARWLSGVLNDQIAYHHNNHRKLDHAEIRLRWITEGLFFLAFAAVAYHLWDHDQHWPLLLTAGVPALAAALHGASTQLGIRHRAALSGDMEQTLRQIDRSLSELIAGRHSAKNPEHEVRAIAYEAAKEMGGENKSWHALVRRYKDQLP